MKWPMVSLLSLCDPKQWPTISSKQLTEDGYPVYGANGFIGHYHSYNHEKPTILITCRGATCGTVNISPPKTYVTGNAMALDEPKLKTIDFRFLYYALIARGLKDTITGAAQPQITRANLSRVTLPMPALSEQRCIVEILDQADALRKKRAEADAKAERILPALFIKMFGDPVTNPKGWDQIPLEKLLRDGKGALQSGPFGSNLHNSDFVDEGTIFVVGIDNVHDSGFQLGRSRRITEEKYQELKKYKLEPGDVLITIMGTVGRTCVFPEWVGEAICTKHVYRIQTSQDVLDPEYLCASIRFSPTVRAQLGASITGQIVDAITSKNLRELKVEHPPLELQKQFSQIKKSLDHKALQRQSSRKKIDQLFETLLHRAFSGDLTAKWREAHMKELLVEMEEQAKYLNSGLNDHQKAAELQGSLF